MQVGVWMGGQCKSVSAHAAARDETLELQLL